MKKKSKIVIEKRAYCEKRKMGNYAFIELESGEKGLFDKDISKIVLLCKKDDFIYFEDKNGLILIIGKSNTVKIYDINKRELIIDGWEIRYRHGGTYLLKSSTNGKIYLFDKNYYSFDNSMLERGFDDINSLDENYFRVSLNGKFGIYLLGQGLVTEVEYDNIVLVGYTKIYDRKGREKIYALITDNEQEIFSTVNNETFIGSYNHIRVDGEIVTGIKEDDIGNFYDFYYYNEEIGEYDLLNNILCSTVGEISFKDGNGYIISKNGNKMKIDIYQNYTWIPLLEDEYDLIFLNKDEGFSVTAVNRGKGNRNVNSCDKVLYLDGDYYYVVIDGIGDIVKIEDSVCQTIIPMVKNVINCSDTRSKKQFMYIKNEKQGMIEIDGEEITITDLYDRVQYVGLRNAIVTTGMMSGLMQNGQLIIPCDYDKIYSSEVVNSDEKNLYFAFRKNKDQKYELARTFSYGVGVIKIGDFDDVIFYRDIMVLEDNEDVFVCDYQNNCLASFNHGTVIEENISLEGNNEVSYLVNGMKWTYRDGKFEEMPFLKEELYLTGYECKYGTIAVSSNNKIEHDKMCALVESINSKEIEETLLSFYEQTPMVRTKYPKLVRKK